MNVLKWICFILVCLDTLSYFAEKFNDVKNVATFIGLLLGTAARVFVLYNTATHWLLT